MLKINYTIFEDGRKIKSVKNKTLKEVSQSFENMLGRQGATQKIYVLYLNKISNKEFYQIADNYIEVKRIQRILKSQPQYSNIHVINSRPKYAEKR